MRASSLAIALACALAALPARAADQNTQRTDSGAELFRRYCAACHGVNADGNGPLAADLKVAPPNLTRLSEKFGSPLPRARIAAFVDGRMEIGAHGTREMPVWGEKLYDTTPPGMGKEAARRGTVALIVEYLDSIQAPNKN